MLAHFHQLLLALIAFHHVCSSDVYDVISAYSDPGRIYEDGFKIVGLVPVRNEARRINFCLRALAVFTDSIVVLDDMSTDNTVSIVENLAEDCKIERIITKSIWDRNETADRNELLTVGRSIGGTHFVVIDADEAFTGNLADGNELRTQVYSDLCPRARTRVLVPSIPLLTIILHSNNQCDCLLDCEPARSCPYASGRVSPSSGYSSGRARTTTGDSDHAPDLAISRFLAVYSGRSALLKPTCSTSLPCINQHVLAVCTNRGMQFLCAYEGTY